jgi:hypothetical protein
MGLHPWALHILTEVAAHSLGERVSRGGAVTSRRGTGEGLVRGLSKSRRGGRKTPTSALPAFAFGELRESMVRFSYYAG